MNPLPKLLLAAYFLTSWPSQAVAFDRASEEEAKGVATHFQESASPEAVQARLKTGPSTTNQILGIRRVSPPTPSRISVESTLEMSVVFDRALALADQGKQVLVAFDIDNTLLAPRADYLGSDPWFEEEMSKLAQWRTPATEELFQKRKGQLVKLQEDILKAGLPRLEPTEAGLAAGLRLLHKRPNIRTVAITAREAAWHPLTLEALDKHGINLSDGAMEFGEEFERKLMFKGPKVYERALALAGGVILTDRQDKGKILIDLFLEWNYSPEVVVFVDDKEKHVQNVVKAFGATSIELWAYRYSREDESVSYYQANEYAKRLARAQLYYFITSKRSHFPSKEEADRIADIYALSESSSNAWIFGVKDPSKPDTVR